VAETDAASFIFNGLGSNKLSLPSGFPGIVAGTASRRRMRRVIDAFAQSGYGSAREPRLLYPQRRRCWAAAGSSAASTTTRRARARAWATW
jgi:hypothetical protein